MSETTPTIIGYVRVSAQKQVDDGNSPETQRGRIEAWAASKGWAVTQIYTDLAKSAKSMENRPQLHLALKHVCDTRGILVSFKLDRWARSVADAGAIAERLQRNGAGLVSITEAFDTTTSTGRLMYNILASFAQFAREVTVERTQAGMDYLKENGLRAGTVPYGWVSDGGKLVANADEQAVLARMQSMREAGTGYRAIATALNNDGIPSKSAGLMRKGVQVSGKWCPQSIKSVLDHAKAGDK